MTEPTFARLPRELRALLPGGEGGTVDVVVFARAFEAWAHESGRDVDLVAAGMLARRAWEALRAESEQLLAREREPDVSAAAPPDAWTQILAVLEDAYDPAARFNAAIAAGASPLTERAPLRPRPSSRHVTLMELVDALEAAQAEASRRARALAARPDRRAEARASVVDEDPARDLERVLARLPATGEERALRDLAETSAPVDRVATLVAVLQLAKQGRVVVRQEAFPTSPILVRLVRQA